MKTKSLLSFLTAIFLLPSVFAQSTVALWTFETSAPITAGPISPETGSGSAIGSHANTAVYSSPAGNASAKCWSSTVWAAGDYWQFQVSTLGFQTIGITFDQASSGNGPRDFNFQYSTDGSTFTTFGSTYIVLTNGATANNEGTGVSTAVWTTGGTRQSAYLIIKDLSSIPAINNKSTVYFRIMVADGISGSGGAITTIGTSRVDNFLVTATTIPGLPSITANPQNTIAYKGDSVNLSVTASGTAPLAYQWYYTNSSGLPFVPLMDGSSGFGAGVITNSTNTTLTLTYAVPAQSGGYKVVVTNSLGSVTSQVATVTINTRTPITNNIAFLRMLQDPVNWTPIDVTNIYSSTGIVTSPFNFTTGNNAEFFMQDNTGRGIAVFSANGTSLPNPGDVVRVNGPLGQFRGLFDFNLDFNNPAHSISTISTGNPLPLPIPFDLTSLTNIPYIETNIEGSMVIISNVFLQQPQPAGFVSGGSINMTNANGKVLSLFVNAGNSDITTKPVPVFAAFIIGHFGQFTSSIPATNSYELDLLQYSDLAAGTTANIPFAIKIDGTNAVLTWNGTLFNLQSATNVAGPYTTIDGAASPYTNAYTANNLKFYRLVH